ncbi:succinic semialdehyde dehydrogenase [Vulgatibacter incomptus]|uniref:Aldehyde dehydrogenase n=1 Tax=Vulgatibacter incomptus TaxID=1391653 RepID=A0A0K1PDE1_9BACT|nr:succinic semialdehyde dehydrogenase [Vulgatibacter incomptus]AKU91421.1 Aldehyde dehydrogenase [Vulgatibacter incomptus]
MESESVRPSAGGRPAAAKASGARGRIDQGMLDRLSSRVTSLGGRDAIPVYLPFSGEVLGHVPRCNAEDVREAARRAGEAQRIWSHTRPAHRRRIFLRFHDRVLSRQDEILDLIQLESGKARRHAFEEVMDTAIVSRYYANSAEEHLKARKRRGAIPGMTTTWETFQPKGVVGFISPWNYPLILSITDAIPALLAGNGVVLKPDHETPFSALWAVELLVDSGLPPSLFQVVTGQGSEIGPALIESVDFISFTGSTETGRKIARDAGEKLIDCSLELGGKNAMIVLADADLEKAVAGAVQGCFTSGGQSCISIERLYVHSKIYETFVHRFVEKTRALRLGSALDYGVDMGSLTSSRQLHAVEAHVEEAVAKGASVLAGGRSRPDLGPYFYEPTILENVQGEMRVFRDETFGPVVSVYRFRSDDEAVERANDSRYGLSASVWTRDHAKGRAIAEQVRAGTVNINEPYAAAWGSVDSPMGGIKDSGIGRRHGREGIRKYTESKTIAHERGPLLAAPQGATAGRRYSQLMTGLLQAWRRIPGIG